MRSGLRIVHYLSSVDLRDGGVVRAVLDLCPALAAAGQDVTLLTFNAADVPSAWLGAANGAAGTVRCVTVPRPGLGGLLGGAAMREVRRVVGGADVVHIHSMWLPSNDQVARACRRAGVPYVWTPHGMLDDWCMAQKPVKKRLYHTLVANRTLRLAAAVHCTAEAERDQASKWFRGGRAEVVPLPFDLADYRDLPGPELARAEFGLPANVPVVLFLSRLHPKKGLEALIQACGKMQGSGELVHLVIAGGGDEAYERSLRALVARHGLESDVSFVGFVKGREKVSLYQAADVFVLPSSQENFGYVVVEALAAGTPVITTKGVALWPQLERENVAVLVEPAAQPLAETIERLLDDPARARELGQRGRAWCEREMDPAKIIAGFVDMYSRAAATIGRGARR